MATHTYNERANDLYWTRDDLRNTDIIGFQGAREMMFRFTTAEGYPSHTKTIVQTGVDLRTVAHLDWTGQHQLGMVTLGKHRFPMTSLLQPGTPGSRARSRRFSLPRNGAFYEWRQDEADTSGWTLYDVYNARIARFDPGPFKRAEVRGHMRYYWSDNGDDELLLFALMALMLNRWVLRYEL
ncbi:hypothetical protein BOTBODRAFT_192884 [Botryobasidium botryosum FD-172 SS1]|uniref:DUF6593 domain-containing protein n=1 Tax=Botryobasidium botryosum (strain FD-172 SS1) TaxID=930990 RepID=A0A067M4E7_BOTB1|nr:hypothetical protein BOTBODRAFT_192884 [Botryobasidium botryosum FD-172 SS1]